MHQIWHPSILLHAKIFVQHKHQLLAWSDSLETFKGKASNTLQKSLFRPCPFLAFNHFLEEDVEDLKVGALIVFPNPSCYSLSPLSLSYYW